jgi:Family of unknown function (DUF6117)
MSKKKKPDTIVTRHKKNFNTLCKVFKEGSQALVACKLKATGEEVAVICAITHDDTEGEGSYNITPFAMFFNGNPYELLEDPTQDNIKEGVTS